MAKVHAFPQVESSSCSASTSCMSSKPETFTIWMKSLLMQTNGCTVFNKNGEIVYRVDNYDKKAGSNEVYLMDLKGNVLFTILRRKLFLFRQWRGYKSDGLKSKPQEPYFQVKRCSEIFERDLSCQIAVRSSDAQESCYYKLEALSGKLAFKITNSNGEIVAEAKRKQSSKGVLLGDDVLTLAVEPHTDHSFIMALVTVYGLMHHKL
ncbi:protein LURP-one-related 4-like [Populus alba x Populus x berolinensis]|nr:protein LURP-one-related 4-like [Populus alba x Populus x berolinensis]